MNTIRENLPEDFRQEMKELLGDEYDIFLASYEKERTNAIRINTLKTDLALFKDKKLFGIDYEKDKIPWADLGYYIDEGESPGKNPLHDAGSFYIQEPSAMSVVGQTEIFSGERILDMCAAPGGKSTYIASKLENTGILVSNEINPNRIKALGENLERFGAANCIITNSNSKDLLKFFKGFFDKVFIDAPCSGSGMFRKDEYAISDWSVSKVEECAQIQREIIRDGYDMLRAGGMIIYSTCTFTKEENEDIIEEFLDEYPTAQLLNIERIWPHRDRGEGHFCARIIKKSDEMNELCTNSSYDKKEKKSKIKSKNLQSLKLFDEFVSSNISPDSDMYVLLQNNTVEQRQGFIYLVPKGIGELRGLKVLRKGLLLGELKKNRFEPAHSWAMAMKPSDVKNKIDFGVDDEELARYIFGESIAIEYDIKGWVLICIEGVSIGWAKSSDGILKNKYPKGLRRNIKK